MIKLNLGLALKWLGFAAMLFVASCSTQPGLSLVDYGSVTAAPPSSKLTGLWTGPHAGGSLFIEVLADGGLNLCLSAPPYYQQLDGKYFDHAFYLEDGTRIEIKIVGRERLAIFSPPGRLAATLTASADTAAASRCVISSHDAATKVAGPSPT